MKLKLLYFFHRYWCCFFRHTRKNSHLFFFTKSFFSGLIPTWIFRQQLDRKLNRFYQLPKAAQKYIQDRVCYYCKITEIAPLPDEAVLLKDFTYTKRKSYTNSYINSTYFYDAYEYVRYFSKLLRWAYAPGDINYILPFPTITKSRPITADDKNKNNVLLNLDKVRHFTWINDPFTWEQKKCRIIFRGDTRGKKHREDFINMWQSHPWCDMVSTSDNSYKQMPIYDHLRYRYIMALEGNDVASNLKWVMSSNSVAVMPKPKYETWYMEGKLIPNYHYIEIADDYHDLIDKITYYEAHPKEVTTIIRHAHEWVAQFRNKKREELISLMVLDKYFILTGQKI